MFDQIEFSDFYSILSTLMFMDSWLPLLSCICWRFMLSPFFEKKLQNFNDLKDGVNFLVLFPFRFCFFFATRCPSPTTAPAWWKNLLLECLLNQSHTLDVNGLNKYFRPESLCVDDILNRIIAKHRYLLAFPIFCQCHWFLNICRLSEVMF